MKSKVLLLLVSLVFFSGCAQMPYVTSFVLPSEEAQVLIQAGHEDTMTNRTGTSAEWGDERDWTPIIADEATRVLEEAGISVIRENAHSWTKKRVDLALSIHFDGREKTCTAGASIGYDDCTDKPAADEWKAIYREVFPFEFLKDNNSSALREYYQYYFTITGDAELVLEMGELTCEEQGKWLKPRLEKLGQLVAYFAARRLGYTNVSKPEI